MNDESNMGPVAAVAGTDAEVKTLKANKQRPPPRQQATAELLRAASKATVAKSPTAKTKRSSEQERIEKLKLIQMRVAGGTSTLKDAIKSSSISEQTYYNWKRAVRLVEQTDEKPIAIGDELADLVQLELENEGLRKILAEKLRGENASLRKRLGLN